ncbi:MAG: Gfo/Idh/MocA family oxidoreductase [Cyclobacteriaceae bacterium]|nr:Gfo/Idh/MocA family oxidoreductase [Cyclobacteriaceae bacterium]
MKNKQIDRRNFMKGTALATGGVMMAGLPVGASAFVNPKAKKLKLALVGCGGRGTGATVQALTADPDVKLIAMCDAFKDRIDNSLNSIMNSEHLAEDRKKNVKIKEKNKYVGFDGYKEAIKNADVVILATPPGFRPYHLEECINQGKHVFCEKPLATDSVGIRKCLDLVKVAESKKLNIVVGLQRHYQTKYREIIKRVNDGAIGDVISGQVYWNGGGVWVRERKPEYTEMQYQMRNWYYFNWLCGDHIVEQHIHNLDVFNWVKDAYPVSAQGMGGRQVRTGKDTGEIFDHHYVEFMYEDGSILNSQCRHIKGCKSDVSETLIGTKGRVDTRGSGTIADLSGNSIYKHRGKDDPNPYQVEHDELFASIREGGAINDLKFGAMSTMTAILGRYATYTGVEVKMEDALASDVQLMSATNKWSDNPPVMPNADGYYPIAVPGKSMVF